MKKTENQNRAIMKKETESAIKNLLKLREAQYPSKHLKIDS